MLWSYGITTVNSRKMNLLPRTIASLAGGGFKEPRLFVDGEPAPHNYAGFGLDVTTRYPTIRTAGNWILSLWELYLRKPQADRYAIFQDDIVTYKNLREYLEGCEYPEKGYWNLITYPKNESGAKVAEGWSVATKRGKGAQALVFDRKTVIALLGVEGFISKPQNRRRGHRCIDGTIVESMGAVGYKEYVHLPTLVFHTGEVSVMNNGKQPKSISFRGEDFDALQLSVVQNV